MHKIYMCTATSFLRSNLMTAYQEIKDQFLSSIIYPFALLQKVLPLFIDEFQLPQLILILTSKALPSIIDTPAREVCSFILTFYFVLILFTSFPFHAKGVHGAGSIYITK